MKTIYEYNELVKEIESRFWMMPIGTKQTLDLSLCKILLGTVTQEEVEQLFLAINEYQPENQLLTKFGITQTINNLQK
jgi:hypothetical protein